MSKKWFTLAIFVFLIATAFNQSPKVKLQDGVCPSAPARLKQADIAVLTTDLNLRVQPDANSKKIMVMPAYAYVTIIAGPICNGGVRWFETGYEGNDGWAAEVGSTGEYHMIPNGSPMPTQQNAIPNQDANPQEDNGGWWIVPDGPAPIFKVAAGRSYFFRDWENGQFRTIPNDDTLEALGYPKDQIEVIPGDNLTFDSDFTFGPDVPDVHNDPDGFCAFKYQYFASYPNPSWSPCGDVGNETPTQTPQPLVEVPIETIEEPFFCSWWIIGWLACDLAEANSVGASTNVLCSPQCVTEARKQRRDLAKIKELWAYNSSTAKEILDLAYQTPTFNLDGQSMQVKVRDSGETAKAGDLVIWPQGCGDVTFSGGHIGYALSDQVGKELYLHDSNSDNLCTVVNRTVEVESCMKFITPPFPASADKCDEPKGWDIIVCSLPWYGNK